MDIDLLTTTINKPIECQNKASCQHIFNSVRIPDIQQNDRNNIEIRSIFSAQLHQNKLYRKVKSHRKHLTLIKPNSHICITDHRHIESFIEFQETKKGKTFAYNHQIEQK